MEIWRDIPGYEGLYQVSNLGRVRSLDRYVKQNHGSKQLKRGKIIQPIKDCKGYLRLKLCINNTSKRISIHRLVAQVFIPNLDNKPQVNHIDGDKTNNRVDNLEWVTNQENVKHAWSTGLAQITDEARKKMSKNNTNKKQVMCMNTKEIFNSIIEASKKYKINSSHISECCKGKRKSAGKHPVTKEKMIWEYVEE